MRIGQGYDIHKLVEGRKLIIGGVEIPFDKGLLGHSDADVLTHAIIDSLLGAAALGDIGSHFSDTEDEWKNANSIDLLKKTGELIASVNLKIENIDSTVICEAPKLRVYIDEMRETISTALGISIDQVNIKAKTNEKLDSIGKGEAIAAQAIVLLN